MKIRATRYEDLQKSREEYDAETRKLSDVKVKQETDYHRALGEQTSDVERKVAALIGSTPLDMRIQVDPYGRGISHNAWRISVQVHEGDKFDDNTALAWNWEVTTDEEGNIIKDSGSWSGLKITTPEQIADLEESIRVMKVLNNADWKDILESPRSDYYDFVDKEVSDELYKRKQARPDFEKDMLSAHLEDLIGTNIAIQLSGDEYYRGNVGIVLTGMTDKFLKGYIFPWSLTNRNPTLDDIKKYVYNEDRKASKNKVVTQNGMPVEFQLA